MAKKSTAKPKAKRRASVKNSGGRTILERFFADQYPESSSGETVSARDMLGYPPAFHCINKVSGHIGYLTINLHERDKHDERKKSLAESVPAHWLIKYRPNPLMIPTVFKQTVQGHAMWSGNGRAFIQRNLRGEPEGLWPLPPARCTTVVVEANGDETDVGSVVLGRAISKWHIFRRDDGTKVPIADRDVLHIPGFGYDGIQGYAVLDLAREWLGRMKAQNKAIGGNFKNSARPGIIIKAPDGAFKTQAEAANWLANFNANHAGPANDGKASMMTGGMDAMTLATSARESQWQEQLVFTRQDSGLWFAVEHMLGDGAPDQHRSLEEKNRAYVTNCLNKWSVIWEQECWSKLLTTQQRESLDYYFKFQMGGLTKGSLLDRYQAYAIGKQNEFLSTNDIRELEDMDAIDGGDEYINPVINPHDTPRAQPAKSQPQDTHNYAMAAKLESLSMRMKAMASSRLGELSQVEANRVKSAAETATNFCEWIDNFYQPTQFTARIESTFSVVGLSSSSAADYAEESKRQLLGVADRCTQEQLPVEVSRVVASWANRIEQLAAVAAGVT